MDVYALVVLVIGVVGAISSVWYIYERLSKPKRLSWKFAQKAVIRISNQMRADNFSPSIIIGIGRGGAIMGAMISGVLGHRPLIVIDRKYQWPGGRRIDGMIQRMDITFGLDKVLLVAGEVHSGNTMRLYYDFLKEIGAGEICRATLFYEKGATEPVEYKGIVSSNKEMRMPWMFTEDYRREDRGPEEAKGLRGDNSI